MRILSWLLTNAVALAAAAWLVDGVRFTGTGPVLLLGDREVPVEQVTGFSTVATDTSSPSTT